jgi:two-component system LytT family response regulator
VRITTLIVDDEELARERVRSLLATDRDLELVGECSNGLEAVEAIRNLSPKLVFLDVQMPELDGFGVLEAVGPAAVPAVVLVTAHDQYALRAFEYVALDYLLKPFDEARFRSAVERAKASIRSGDRDRQRRQLDGLLESLGRGPLRRLVVKESGRIFFVDTTDVRWIEAQGNYVQIHAAGDSHLVRRSMKGLMSRLDPARFLRIHRSIIVNIDRVKELRPLFHGEYSLLLDDGTELTSNRSFKDDLQRLLEDSF